MNQPPRSNGNTPPSGGFSFKSAYQPGRKLFSPKWYEKKTSRIMAGLLAAGLVMLLIFLLGFLIVNPAMRIIIGHNANVVVPDITGMDFELARLEGKKSELYVQVVNQVPSESFKKGVIISQDPPAGSKTRKQRTVKVVVSLGPEGISVPNIVSQPRDEARRMLEKAGLSWGKETPAYSDHVGRGLVISTQPPVGENMPKGSKINVTISLGKMEDSGNKSTYEKLLEDDTTPATVNTPESDDDGE